MRPSNESRDKAVAGDVVTATLLALAEMGYNLSLQEMRFLMDRVEARMNGAKAKADAANGKEVRA